MSEVNNCVIAMFCCAAIYCFWDE